MWKHPIRTALLAAISMTLTLCLIAQVEIRNPFPEIELTAREVVPAPGSKRILATASHDGTTLMVWLDQRGAILSEQNDLIAGVIDDHGQMHPPLGLRLGNAWSGGLRVDARWTGEAFVVALADRREARIARVSSSGEVVAISSAIEIQAERLDGVAVGDERVVVASEVDGDVIGTFFDSDGGVVQTLDIPDERYIALAYEGSGVFVALSYDFDDGGVLTRTRIHQNDPGVEIDSTPLKLFSSPYTRTVQVLTTAIYESGLVLTYYDDGSSFSALTIPRSSPLHVQGPTHIGGLGQGAAIIAATSDRRGCLLMWRSLYTSTTLNIARLDETGKWELDAGDIDLLEIGRLDSIALRWDGSTYFVAIASNDAQATPAERGLFFGRASRLPGSFNLAPVRSLDPQVPLGLVATDEGYAAIWRKWGTEAIYFSRLDPRGKPIGAPVEIELPMVSVRRPWIAWLGTDGSRYLMVWQELITCCADFGDGSAFALAIDSAGQTEGEWTEIIHESGYDVRGWGHSPLMWTGTEFRYAYVKRGAQDGAGFLWSNGLGVARISRTGSPLGFTPDPLDASELMRAEDVDLEILKITSPTLLPTESGAFLYAHVQREPFCPVLCAYVGPREGWIRRISETGDALGAPAQLHRTEDEVRHLRVAYQGDMGVAFADSRLIRTTSFSREGLPLDSNLGVDFGCLDQINAVIPSPRGFTVIWPRDDTLQAMQLDPSVPLDAPCIDARAVGWQPAPEQKGWDSWTSSLFAVPSPDGTRAMTIYVRVSDDPELGWVPRIYTRMIPIIDRTRPVRRR